MNTSTVSDQALLADTNERASSIDPSRSCIVQAPAGSGKTALLTQRFLGLLALVDEPEEIIAITFTRKACAEMRQRIISALTHAHSDADEARATITPHHQRLHALAKRAALRDHQRQWRLTQHPMRLRILTIDALAHSLVRNMPWLARLGSHPIISDNADELYQLAIDRVLAELADDPSADSDLAQVLAHQDGDIVRLQRLLILFLQHREQYLSWFPCDLEASREPLEAALKRTVKARTQHVSERFPPARVKQLQRLAKEAVKTAEAVPDTPLAQLAAHAADDDTLLGQCALWRSLAALLLTDKGCWRKQLTKKQGFLSAATATTTAAEHKRTVLEALDELRQIATLDQALHALRNLPDTRYNEVQWRQLKSLIRLAHRTVASLRVTFSERQRVDFAEVTMAAIAALGPEDNPTDLGLALDYRIHHLLIDEYQDTSHSHHTLITRLLAGWLPDDGRTLFVVGDPMQSIYRFRQADVGLFIHSMTAGIADVDLQTLHLCTNFRSCAGIVEWNNRIFAAILPPHTDAVIGAAGFKSAIAAASPTPPTSATPAAVVLHPFAGSEEDTEARYLVDLIADEQKQYPRHTIAVLVRARAHLNPLLPKLNRRGVAWRGIKLQPLREVPLIIDLTSLARALCHAADRVAWLAVLRAPWCGLSLADLHQLVASQPQTLIIDALGDSQRLALLSADTQQRCQRVHRVMVAALAERGQRPLRCCVEGAWLALGGAACVAPSMLPDAERFLQRLDEVEQESGSIDPDQIGTLVDDLYAAPLAQAGVVEIMTIHQAKGLEFDTVFLPGLNRKARRDDRRLIEWAQIINPGHANDLLLAPWSLPNQDNRIRDLIHVIERDRDQHESTRLVYVATTRARQRLHLLACCDIAECFSSERQTPPPEERAPASGSLLALLWPAIEAEYRAAAKKISIARTTASTADNGIPSTVTRPPRRLPTGWTPPPLPSELHWYGTAPPMTVTPITFVWASHTAIAIGDLVHRLLKCIADEGLAHWSAVRVQQAYAQWRNWLSATGVSDAELDSATQRVQSAITAVLQDQRGRWLLHPHTDASSELSLSAVEARQVAQFRIDRTFIDEHGRRFIVDYKSGYHGGGDLEQFLAQEQLRYREQLERYARLLLAKSGGRAHLGLYFPLHQGWREWVFDVAQVSRANL